jgi:hypothetical protein
MECICIELEHLHSRWCEWAAAAECDAPVVVPKLQQRMLLSTTPRNLQRCVSPLPVLQVGMWLGDGKLWEGHLWLGPTWKDQSDMEALDVFIQHECPSRGLKCHVMSHITTNENNNSKPWDVRYNVMFSLHWLFKDGKTHTSLCDMKAFDEYIGWSVDHNNLPVPVYKPSATQLLILHFQGTCKDAVLMPIYVKHFLGLVN